MKGSINTIETSGFVDGPGIRTVVFLNGCKLRCKYCHNPEMWHTNKLNYTVDELVKTILHNKDYYGNRGGVTFSGGEPLLQSEFLLEVCKRLKQENIHITLDTAGVGNNDYTQLLRYVDLILLDIKDIKEDNYYELTNYPMEDSLKFIDICNKLNKKIWIRQVIVPGRNDNLSYLKSLNIFLNKINNIERIDFLPYHNMALTKYQSLGINYPYQHLQSFDKAKCHKLYEQFIKIRTNG